MNIKVISDSTCDLPKELVEKYDIAVVPLTVIKDNQKHSDGVDITTADIFAHVAGGGDLCTTAALNIEEYMTIFSGYANKYDGVIHINISSGFSSCYQNACIAAEEFDNVRVIDSQNLSTGQGLIVLKACELAKTCQSLDELVEKINAFVPKVETSFVLDRLEYMVKGGRCSSAAALGANLLGLKPCIEVKDGKMAVVKKYRGNYSKCLATYIKERLTNRDDLDRGYLFVTRTPIADDCLQAVEATVAECADFENIYWVNAGCTVSCHCGPGTLGVIFIRK